MHYLFLVGANQQESCNVTLINLSLPQAASQTTSVAGIAQHKDVTWHSIKDSLEGRTRIGATDDGSVGCLAFIHQLVPLDVLSLGTQGSSCHESTVAILQQLQGILRCHRWVCSRTNLSHNVTLRRAQAQGICDLSEEAHDGRWKKLALARYGLIKMC